MEDKLNDLLKQVSSIQSELGELDNRISDVARSSERTSKDIKVEINNVNKSLQTLVAGHTVGAYDINLAGIIITLCGTIIQAL